MEFRNYKLVYRRYASLYFIVGIDDNEVSECTLSFHQEQSDDIATQLF